MKIEDFPKLIAREKDQKQQELLRLVRRLAETVSKTGGRVLVVGGYPRDLLLERFGYDIKPKDIDLEIFGLDTEKLYELLSSFGPVNRIGESFSVFKLKELDIAIPRQDSKISPGHTGFEVAGDPKMTFKQAAKRRDFTINAIALDPLTNEIIDEYGGIDDIKKKILRAVDSQTFAEDPLRVLRVMQFAGRFQFKVESETVELCRRIDLSELSWERIGDEWQKLLLKSPQPSVGLEVARDILVLDKLLPEIRALIGMPQSARYHPEGDVWIHTLMVVDYMAAQMAKLEKHIGCVGPTSLSELRGVNTTFTSDVRRMEKQIMMWAALCHDLGKPPTTKITSGKITSYGHSEAGCKITQALLSRMKISQDIINHILPLILNHLVPIMSPSIGETGVRRLAKRLYPATIQELVWLAKADYRGSGNIDNPPLLPILLRKAEELKVRESAPVPIVMGRHLIEMGLVPGPRFKKFLNELFEAQLEGKFFNLAQGLEYFHRYQDKLKDQSKQS